MHVAEEVLEGVASAEELAKHVERRTEQEGRAEIAGGGRPRFIGRRPLCLQTVPAVPVVQFPLRLCNNEKTTIDRTTN